MTDAPNPAANRLPQGISEEMLVEAVEKSGYPLQTTVAALLESTFHVQQEWAYVDESTGLNRSTDVLADRQLFEFGEQLRVRPHLTLLTECKRSELPIVFFRSIAARLPNDYPPFCGLRRPDVALVYEKDMDGTNFTSITRLLSLHSAPYVVAPVPICASVAGTARKGKGLELTGSDMFQSVTQPLTKALRHFAKNQQPPSTALYFDLHAVLCLAVLDAPMFLVEHSQDRPAVSPTTWVRLLRHEHDATQSHRFDRDRSIVVDVVHVSSLREFIDVRLKELAEIIEPRVKGCAEVLRQCAGVATGSWRDDDIHHRVRGTRLGAKATAMLKAIGYL